MCLAFSLEHVDIQHHLSMCGLMPSIRKWVLCYYHLGKIIENRHNFFLKYRLEQWTHLGLMHSVIDPICLINMGLFRLSFSSCVNNITSVQFCLVWILEYCFFQRSNVFYLDYKNWEYRDIYSIIWLSFYVHGISGEVLSLCFTLVICVLFFYYFIGCYGLGVSVLLKVLQNQLLVLLFFFISFFFHWFLL